MTIQVFGSGGCQTCKKLFNVTRSAVKELNLPDGIEYIEDIEKIIAMGVLQTPVLVINDKPVFAGKMFNLEKIKKIIKENLS